METNSQNFEQGCILLSRSLRSSAIFRGKPAWYLKVWLELLLNANYKDHGGIKRGTVYLPNGLADLQAVLRLEGGYGKKKYEKSAISRAISWMSSEHMIATRRSTRGMHIEVLNYNEYQDLRNYDTQQETQKERNERATGVSQKRNRIPKKEIKKESNKYTREMFEADKDSILAEAETKYPDKDCRLVMQEFITGTAAKDYKYTNYKMAYFNWVTRSQHKKQTSSRSMPTLKEIEAKRSAHILDALVKSKTI